MQCARCRTENVAARQFCGECGQPLAVACPSCGFLNEGDVKFCGGCGTPTTAAVGSPRTAPTPDAYTPKHLAERILTSKAALEGERKQVTVLFADVKGSMEMLAERDPEEARKLLDPVLELMMDAVHRYEGTVNQVMGDGIMALFGAPIAHEDHAVRACYAALSMQQTVGRYAEGIRRSEGVPIRIRIGLNSGEVVVRSIASNLHMDYTAVGQTTHLAARMEQMADPGAILITPRTLALAEGFVEVKALGPVPVKGLAHPIEMYEITGAGAARTRLQAAARLGLTRFVGRDAEIEQLRHAQQRAGAGHGQVAAIVGEAGVGKSRLVYEFIHSHRLQGWLVLEGASVSYGKATSYRPIIDLLKGYFKIQERDDLREIREKVTGKLLTLDRSLESALPALLALLDAPVDDAAWRMLDPGQRRQRTLHAVKRLLLREAREQALVVIFEDLHWIDNETQVLLDTLIDSLASARLLLLVNYRPEYHHSWGGKTYYTQLRLDALSAKSAGALLDALLGDDPGLAPLKQLLVKRGNPFFLEETVRTLVETQRLAGERGRYRLTQPVQAIEVPATVQAMLAARIDRLLPEDKRLLQVASVVGKDVPLALLQAVADLPDEPLRQGLDRLQGAEFLYETGLYPDLEYTFKHALTHEVTYGGLLHERRRELHARIVGAIEVLHRERLGEQIERLAYHAHRGELREKAVQYLRQAGLKAAARSALQEARSWFEQSLAVLDRLPESSAALEQAFDIRLELRPVLSQLGETGLTLERLREAEGLAQRLNDERKRGRVCAFTSNTYMQFDELDEALASAARALAIARSLGDLELELISMTYLGDAHYFGGEYERAVELAAATLAALPPDRIFDRYGTASSVSVYVRNFLARSLAELGRFDEAAEHVADAVSIAEQTHHAFTVGIASNAARIVHALKGDWVKARSVTEHGIAVVRAGNVLLLLPPMVASSAMVMAQLGETSEALNRLWESEQLLMRHMISRNVGTVCLLLSRACLLLGRLDQALSLGHRALEACRRQPGSAAHALHLLGDIATHPDRFDADVGGAHYRHAMTVATARGMRPLVAHCHASLGKLYRRTHKHEDAHEHFTRATTMYREMGMTYWLENAEPERKARA